MRTPSPFLVAAVAGAMLHPSAFAAAPVARSDAATLQYGQKVRVAVLANDTGLGPSPTVAIVQAPQFGTAVPDAAGQILYTHLAGTPAGDSFTYRVSGPGGTSAPATVTLTFVTTMRIANSALNVPANPPPTAVQVRPAFGALPFTQPVCLASPPGETDRLFVCEKKGLLKVIPSLGTASPTAEVFLDLAALLKARGEALNFTFEQGLLGLAFHPQYAANGYFYVFYSVRSGPHSYERLARFSVQTGNPNAADPGSELILIDQLDQAVNHNGGDLHFGPDGYLYVSLGDEGSSFDGLNNSQTITKDFFSGLLRIDVDQGPGSVPPNPHPSIRLDAGVARYGVPKDNPFVPPSLGGTWDGRLRGVPISASAAAKVRSEFWAIGLRNPWRFSFDPLTGELWLGDVGQGMIEEVNLIVRGGNYGWAWREGIYRGPKYRYTTPGFDALYHRKPLYEYVHTTVRGGSSLFKGNSITGGVVYRGSRFASLQGKYIFADYISGHIWALTRNGAAKPTVTRLAGETGISAFGIDPSNGDVLMADYNNGRILRLTAATTGGSFPQTLGATGLFADLSDLSPAPGVLPYTPNVSFWSDFAEKRRWFTVPDAAGQMTWTREGAWTFPEGMIWVKHFDLPRVRSNPPSPNDPPAGKRLETRVLVKNATGVYGVSYRWNDAGTEATLVPDEGADFTVPVTQNGAAYNQRWHIPSRAECNACHSPSAGYALSFDTRQLNRDGSMAGVAGNQLDLLHAAGYFSNVPESPNVLPRHLRAEETAFPVEARVRSYLAV
ncbi:MAG TPA: PQQ-dependent sugar dehydrogenase, partial [Chthoniobacteraceae bacterium]|nr:PQQ-dependent sugar dehydrogenase [Chthoniobacteraceae bacterium]